MYKIPLITKVILFKFDVMANLKWNQSPGSRSLIDLYKISFGQSDNTCHP